MELLAKHNPHLVGLLILACKEQGTSLLILLHFSASFRAGIKHVFKNRFFFKEMTYWLDWHICSKCFKKIVIKLDVSQEREADFSKKRFLGRSPISLYSDSFALSVGKSTERAIVLMYKSFKNRL